MHATFQTVTQKFLFIHVNEKAILGKEHYFIMHNIYLQLKQYQCESQYPYVLD